MRVTEQIDAMEVSGTILSNISLLHELWQPLMPILVFFGCYSSFGSYLVENKRKRFFLLYFNQVFDALEFGI
jgi:hypothetical protein